MLGRLTSDILPWWAVGSGVSTQTTGLAYSFNDAGLPFKQTALPNYDQSGTENQVQDVYNGYGQLIKQYQETSGAVNTGTSASVQYGYSQPTGANYSRLSSMTYPNGRVEDYGYNSGIDATIGRVSSIADDAGSSAGHVAEYTYLGLSTIVVENEPEAGVELSYVQVPGDTSYNSDGGDRYTGLDRFGRVIDQAYYVTTSPPSTPSFTDRLQYGYDRDGNVLYQKNLLSASFSELYHANSSSSGDNNTAYDPLNRLTSFRRGTLTSSGNNGTGLDTITTANLNSTTSVPNTNSWNLDALGNWTSGAGLSNTFNSQNEETANGSNSLAYDNAGSMTTDEIGNTYVYDAWGHVVQIKNSGGSSLETFTYDALGRNDKANNGSGYTSVYYDLAGQQIESRFANTYAQYVWGLAYVNDVILRDRNADGSMSTGNLGITGSGLEEREYAQHDKQFSVISLTSRTGSVIQRLAYDPYGKMTTLTATWTYDSTGGGTNYWFVLFQGMMYVADGSSGNLLQSQTRMYNVDLGRWLRQDPKGYVNGINLYQAFLSAPNGFTDPKGTDIWIEGPSGGEPNGHQSIGIGDPNGNYVSYSFGVGDPAVTWAYGLTGYVYQDTTLGGEIVPDSYLTTDPAFDAIVKQILDDMVRKNEPHEYRLLDSSCRTFSQTFHQAIVDALKKTGNYHPGKAPVRNPRRNSGAGASTTNSGAPTADSTASSSSSSPATTTTTAVGASLTGDVKDGVVTSAIGTAAGTSSSKPCPCAGGAPKPGKIGK